MLSKFELLSSFIPAGWMHQLQSFLRNWDLVLSLSGSSVLNMISGPPAVLSTPKKARQEKRQRPASVVCTKMSVQLSVHIEIDSWLLIFFSLPQFSSWGPALPVALIHIHSCQSNNTFKSVV